MDAEPTGALDQLDASDRADLQAWAYRWKVTDTALDAVAERMRHEAAVPPFAGMSQVVVTELMALPLPALGELRDLFRPDMYP